MAQARQDGISLKQWLPLIGLACCAFVFNTSEFMPIGLVTHNFFRKLTTA